MGREQTGGIETIAHNGLSEVTISEPFSDAANGAVKPADPRLFSDVVVVDPDTVELSFSDGTTWHFHGAWLLDTSRSMLDGGLNRNATISPVTSHYFNGGEVAATAVSAAVLSEDKAFLSVSFGETSQQFSASFLRGYAPIVAKAIKGEQPDYFTRTPLNDTASLNLWDNTLKIPEFDFSDVDAQGDTYEEFMHAIVNPGVALVHNMPDDNDATGGPVSDAMARWVGKLMQHPERETNHWLISTMGYQKAAQSQGYKVGEVEKNPAYNTGLRLLNHTDQVSYGGPGMLLCFHCVAGEGVNSVVDGFKVAQILREQYPNYFKQLTKPTSFGRRIEFYKQPIDQHVFEPIIKLDSYGNIISVRYNEVLRGPVAVPFEEFNEYYAALRKFVELVNSDDLNVHLTLQKGTMIVFNNWRAMHGRKLAAKGRIIVGGTCTHEAYKSRMRLILDRKQDPGSIKDRIALPEAVLAHMASRQEQIYLR